MSNAIPKTEHASDYIAGIYRDAAEVRAYIEAKAKTDEVNCVLGYALSMLAGFLGDDKDSAGINRKLFAEWRASRRAPLPARVEFLTNPQ